jgi:hypothetical protein
MQMEHQQFYKMVAFEASSRVPLVIAGPGISKNVEIHSLHSLVDLLPTFLDLADARLPSGRSIDGQSLVPLLLHGDAVKSRYKDSIISQFHGENLVMSWYMIRKDLADGSQMKYVVWGTGQEHPPQLFNLTADPNEMVNLATASPLPASTTALIKQLDAALRLQVDYPAVTKDVASYNIQMARWWVATTPGWAAIVNGTWAVTGNGTWHRGGGQTWLNEDWGKLWQLGPAGYWKAWNEWIHADASDPPITKCNAELSHAWPPGAAAAAMLSTM